MGVGMNNCLKVSVTADSVFKRLGFVDRDHDGEISIEKGENALSTPMEEDEPKTCDNPQEDPDMNGDGKVSVAEAKYYALRLSYENPDFGPAPCLTEEEKQELINDLQTMFDYMSINGCDLRLGFFRSQTAGFTNVSVANILGGMADLGFQDRALALASTINWDERGNARFVESPESACKDIVQGMVKNGLYEEALRVAEEKMQNEDAKGGTCSQDYAFAYIGRKLTEVDREEEADNLFPLFNCAASRYATDTLVSALALKYAERGNWYKAAKYSLGTEFQSVFRKAQTERMIGERMIQCGNLQDPEGKKQINIMLNAAWNDIKNAVSTSQANWFSIDNTTGQVTTHQGEPMLHEVNEMFAVVAAFRSAGIGADVTGPMREEAAIQLERVDDPDKKIELLSCE